MRVFILLLVLLNILFYLWGEYVYIPPGRTTIEHISPDIYKFELASEAEKIQPVLPEPTVKPEKEAATPSPEIAEVPKTVEEEATPSLVETDDTNAIEESPAAEKPPITAIVVDTDTQTETNEVLLVKNSSDKPPILKSSDKCFTVGPFETDQMLDKAVNLLVEQGISPTQRTIEEQEVSSYRVFIPSTDRSDMLNTSIKALRGKGFIDFYVMTEPGMENAISLGLFRERINAAKQVKRLKAAGLNAELKTRYRDKQYHWLDYKDNNDLINNELFQSWFPDEALQLLPGKCE